MRVAVIPTTGRAPLAWCVKSVMGQVDEIVLVHHRTGKQGLPSWVHELAPQTLHVIDYHERVPNISRMWNLGISKACALAESPHLGDDPFVAVLNDDVEVEPDWFDRVQDAMCEQKAAIGYMRPELSCAMHTRFEAGPVTPLTDQMPGYAWILDTSSNLFVDEGLQWWYSDNDIEWRAADHSAVVGIRGPLKHHYPNSTTVGELAIIAAADRERFQKKWGTTPW